MSDDANVFLIVFFFFSLFIDCFSGSISVLVHIDVNKAKPLLTRENSSAITCMVTVTVLCS